MGRKSKDERAVGRMADIESPIHSFSLLRIIRNYYAEETYSRSRPARRGACGRRLTAVCFLCRLEAEGTGKEKRDEQERVHEILSLQVVMLRLGHRLDSSSFPFPLLPQPTMK